MDLASWHYGWHPWPWGRVFTHWVFSQEFGIHCNLIRWPCSISQKVFECYCYLVLCCLYRCINQLFVTVTKCLWLTTLKEEERVFVIDALGLFVLFLFFSVSESLKFWVMVIWPVALVTIVTQYIVMRMQHGGVLHTVWHPGSKQRDREGPGLSILP